MKTREWTQCALAAACIAICSWIAIPMSVPFTLQTFAVFLICIWLGGRSGCISVLLYLLLGAIGLPVFSGFRGGPGVLFSTTGGYIFGFLLSALFLWLTQRWRQDRPIRCFCACLGALFLCYLCGTLWFWLLYLQGGAWISFPQVLSLCVWPFLVPDLLKIVLAICAGRRLAHLRRTIE